MTKLRLFAIFAILFAIGCDSNWVTVSGRVGRNIEVGKLKSVVGRWCDQENGMIELRVSRKGDLVAGMLSWDQLNETFTSDSMNPDVRELGANVFLFAAEETETILLLVLQPDVDRIELYLPDPEMFRDAVGTGAVAGTIVPKKNEHFCVNLDADDTLESFLASDDLRKYFQSEPLLVYARAKDRK
jgi:hypothetical protein